MQPTDSTKIFHEAFERLYKEQGWSQRSLERASGVSQGLIGKYLNRQNTPGLENLDALAKAMKVSAQALVSGKVPEMAFSPSDSRLLVFGALIAELAPLKENELRAAADHLAALGLIDGAAHAGKAKKVGKV